MAAALGNKYALKWDESREEEAVKLFCDALFIAKDNELYVRSLAELAVQLETYKDVFDYLIKCYSDNNVLSSIKKEILTILEARVTDLAFTKQNPAAPIFILKANHGLIEQQKLDLSNSDGTMKASRLSDEDATRIAAKIKDQI